MIRIPIPEPGAGLPVPSPNPDASASEDAAYWRGYHAALAVQAAPADDASPRVRRVRVDGFTGARQVVFLEAIAEGLTVREAAARAGISVTAVYNFRNRRAGRAFNLAWEAADRRARRPLADHLRDRSVAGQTDTVRDKDGEIVGTRHRHDNRLAMAILTRLDRKAEAHREDERLVTLLAEEFEELLDCIEEDGDAEDFIESRRPPHDDFQPREREPRPEDAVYAGWLRRHRYDHVDPAEVPVADLDPAERDRWSNEQWHRAERSGLLDRIEAETEAKTPVQEPEDER
jgi:AcrR family transcriptional regulator